MNLLDVQREHLLRPIKSAILSAIDFVESSIPVSTFALLIQKIHNH
jgi:hypothetical protein